MDKDTDQGNRERQGENSRLGNTGSSQANERVPAAPQASMGDTPSTGSVPLEHARQVLNNNLDALEASGSRPGDYIIYKHQVVNGHLIYKHQVVNLGSFASPDWMKLPEEMRKEMEEAEAASAAAAAAAAASAAVAAAAAASHTQVDNVDDPIDILVPDRTSDRSGAQGDDGQQAIAHHNKKRKHNEHSENSQERREAPAATHEESSGRELDESPNDDPVRSMYERAWRAGRVKYEATKYQLKVSARKCDDLQKENTGLTQNQAKQARRIAELEQNQAKQARTIAELSQRVAEQAVDIADLTEKTVTLQASQRF